MRTRVTSLALVGLIAALLACGCAKNYVVTTDLAEPLQVPVQFRIGSVTDQLPSTEELKNKPSAEDIEKFKRYIVEELNKADLDFQAAQEGVATYEVTGGITQYKKGSGVVRFIGLFGAGNARAVVELKLVKIVDGAVVFGGNFEGVVSSWAEGGDQMFKRIAHDFAKEIQKQHKAMATQG